MQCPYYVHRALRVLLGLPADKVRVVQTETGGGFGGKEEYPSMIAGHAALLALKAMRPVKIVYDRVEDMLATTKRHPAVIRHRTGVTRDGRLTAMDIEAVFDGGAYATLSAVVLSRGVIHASGPYRCDHVRIRGRAMMTNTPPNGAFRGFGAPQTQFAAEVHMDRIAEAIGLDPVRIREVNALKPGDTTATGQRLGRDCSALAVLRRAVARTDFKRRRRGLSPRQYLRAHGPLVITKEYEKPPGIAWDDHSYRGDAYGSYGWACDVVELEVDRDTWQVTPVKLTTVHEIGKAIHPVLAA